MAHSNALRHVILTGPPGVGKTTLIHKTCEALREKGIAVQGFYTEELRAGRKRTGFDVVTLDGHRGPLARVRDDGGGFDTRRDYRVGQYSVELQAFEHTALPVLQIQADKKPVYVIDEVGKMELFSQKFVQAVRKLLEQPHSPVLATIPVPKGKPISFVEEIRGRKDAKVFMISRENRDSVLNDIVRAVTDSYTTASR